MIEYKGTSYQLQALCCNGTFTDDNWNLNCLEHATPALIRAIYDQKQLRKLDLPGLYAFADWLPVMHTLNGSAAPVTFKSEGLAKVLGLTNLYITFNGFWPEKGAFMQTGSFKECEAFSVCARHNPHAEKVMVVASAGNTARAFAHVCSQNKIPLLICIPEDNIQALWFEKPLDPCVKIIAVEKGGDYYDAIHLSNQACSSDYFYPEGGAKNVARRDGMGTTVLSAVTSIGHIPDYYFQAIGSGTGAIAAWEANLRFIEDGRFGNNKMRLMLSQNYPFVPIKDAWESKSSELLPFDNELARKDVEIILAKVLSNRKPPYSIQGGLFDALTDAGGEVFAVSNEEAIAASQLFQETEGIDVDIAAAVAIASLQQAIMQQKVETSACVMLNITGGGAKLFQSQNQCIYAEPNHVFPVNANTPDVLMVLKHLFCFE